MTDAYIFVTLIGFIGLPMGIMAYLFLFRDPEDR